jgi:flagellar biosynthesis/type III secretory pathway protein FliH
MSSAPERYAFPNAAQFTAALHVEPNKGKIEADDKALRETMQQAYTDGFEHGRAAADLAAKAIFRDAHQQGFAAGCDQGLVQVTEAAAALRQAFEQFREWRAELLNQAETFCVELVLAIVARLLELNEGSAEFVTRTVHEAISVLAPELPHAIFVNPANSAFVASAFPQFQVHADDSIPPGSVRIEAGRLLVDGDVKQAFEQIKSALLETRIRRIGRKGVGKKRLASRSRTDEAPIVEGAD